MVRLVFRPYAHVWQLICTSKLLRPSTRVSSGFSLHKHSSPSFGSQHVRSCVAPLNRAWDELVLRPVCVCCHTSEPGSYLSTQKEHLYFHFAFGFRTSHWLAYMLNSLVRVSRRVRQLTYHCTMTLDETHRGDNTRLDTQMTSLNELH